MEIKAFYTTKQRQKVRKNIIPGNTKSLWRAVNEAKNLNNQELPEVMYHGDVELDWLNLISYGEFGDIYECRNKS